MKKVLIIEDEAAFLRLMGDQLTKDGYEVMKADDGKKGLEMAKSKHPDVILLDIRLPVMDGLAVLHELKADPWGKTAKIIMLTNLEPDKDILAKILVDKPSLYLVKSNIKLSELKGKILNVLL